VILANIIGVVFALLGSWLIFRALAQVEDEDVKRDRERARRAVGEFRDPW
jgi:hypothetical protein